jgi:hypothetical protein
VPAYLAMSYLYKRSNRLWRHLIRRDLTRAVWAPFIHLSRHRHLAYRKELARRKPAPLVEALLRSPRRASQG